MVESGWLSFAPDNFPASCQTMRFPHALCKQTTNGSWLEHFVFRGKRSVRPFGSFPRCRGLAEVPDRGSGVPDEWLGVKYGKATPPNKCVCLSLRRPRTAWFSFGFPQNKTHPNGCVCVCCFFGGDSFWGWFQGKKGFQMCIDSGPHWNGLASSWVEHSGKPTLKRDQQMDRDRFKKRNWNSSCIFANERGKWLKKIDKQYIFIVRTGELDPHTPVYWSYMSQLWNDTCYSSFIACLSYRLLVNIIGSLFYGVLYFMCVGFLSYTDTCFILNKLSLEDKATPFGRGVLSLSSLSFLTLNMSSSWTEFQVAYLLGCKTWSLSAVVFILLVNVQTCPGNSDWAIYSGSLNLLQFAGSSKGLHIVVRGEAQAGAGWPLQFSFSEASFNKWALQ